MKRLLCYVCSCGLICLSLVASASLISEKANGGFLQTWPDMRCVETNGGGGCDNVSCYFDAGDNEWHDIVNSAAYEVCGDPGFDGDCEELAVLRRCATNRTWTNANCFGTSMDVDIKKGDCDTL